MRAAYFALLLPAANFVDVSQEVGGVLKDAIGPSALELFPAISRTEGRWPEPGRGARPAYPRRCRRPLKNPDSQPLRRGQEKIGIRLCRREPDRCHLPLAGDLAPLRSVIGQGLPPARVLARS